MNKKLSLLLLIYFIFLGVSYAQKDVAIKFYESGNKAFAKQDYRTADSLFTLSINIEPHPDSYYNRSVCRRKLNNFKGYCVDLNNAASLNDKEAEALYKKQCMKVETIYKKENGDVTDSANFDVAEFITTYKYKTDFEYEKYNKNGNRLLAKNRIDNIVIYKKCDLITKPIFKGSLDSLAFYIKEQTEFGKEIQNNQVVGFILLSVLIDETGKPKEVKIKPGFEGEIDGKLVATLLNLPNWTPAIYNERAVKYQADLSISIYDSLIYINEDFSLGKIPMKDGIKEVMPEFQGGPFETMKYVQVNIKYPQRAKELGLQGKCYLRFIITPTGKVTNVRVLKGVPKCPECDAEAVKVIQNMPAWKPGTQNGKAVPVFFTLPINFELR